MKYWKNFLGKIGNITKREIEEDNKSLIKNRFKSLEEILSEISIFHKLMADMEEKLTGKFPINWNYIDYNVKTITIGVEKIIRELNEISKNKYSGLLDRFDEINSNVEGLLTRKREVHASRYIIPFDEVTSEMTYNLGVKNANLGEIRNRLKIPTPDGFTISSFAFEQFMEHNNLLEKINEALSDIQGDNLEVLNHVSQEIQDQIIKAEIPYFLEKEILNAFRDLCNRQGAILVARHTSPKFVTVMNKANAIITDFGGATGHMSTLAREFQVPTIVDTEVATEILENGQEITVDAINCTIYEGVVNELAEFSRKREGPFRGTQIFRTLEKVLKWIVPLNLVDPEDKGFRPEFCQTFHDLTRFCHEMAMHEMFNGTDTSFGDVTDTQTLVVPIPLDIHLMDLDGEIKGSQRELRPEKMDFNVKTIEDVIDAIIIKYKKSNLEKKLEILGKLTAYTNRLDVVLSNDRITDQYIEGFIKNHFR